MGISTSDIAGRLFLPEIKPFRQACTHDNGWSDHYGALQSAAAYAGVAIPATYFLRAIWMHGCGGPWLEAVPEALYLNSPKAREWPVFVARKDEVACLTAHGIPRVRAIGLPIVYAPKPDVHRIPGSLLVMPTHTLVGDSFPDRRDFNRYADEVLRVAGEFRRVVVCVHPNCRRNGLWIKEFTQRGFKLVYGAQTNDANALIRMRSLFEQFETMTTNGWGGHVAYALAFGARVSISGTQPKRSEADYLRDGTWAANKDSLKRALATETDLKRREFLRAFHVPPVEAVQDIELGQWFVGANHRISPEEMKGVLREIIDPPPCSPEEAGRREAELNHPWKSKLAAGLAVAVRDRAGAVRLMLEALQAAQASKNPNVILNALIEIPAELGRFDAGRARYLLELALPLADQLQRGDVRVRVAALLAQLPQVCRS